MKLSEYEAEEPRDWKQAAKEFATDGVYFFAAMMGLILAAGAVWIAANVVERIVGRLWR